MFGAGPLLILAAFLIEGFTVICQQRVSFPIRLNLEFRILLTILIGTACFFFMKEIHGLLIKIGINILKKQNELLKTGPFAYVRHPYYSLLLLTLPPLLIVWFSDLLFFISWIVLIAVSHFVVSIEERRLVEVFGDAYEEYRRNVPALIPYRGDVYKRMGKV